MGELLEGKVCVVTGSGSGLGRECALLFAREGASVVVSDIATEAGEQTVAAIDQEGGEATFVPCDVADDDQVSALFAATVKRHGRLDVSMHIAGVLLAGDGGPVDTPLETWHRTLAINLTGVFLSCRHAIPRLLDSGGGVIVNMASVSSFVGAANAQIAYTTSKGGVLALTRELAVMYAREGIRANALCPGPTRTPLFEQLITDAERVANRLEHIPLNRFGEANEVAKAALFLASDLSSYVTGAALLVDGGLSAAYLTRGP
jgi:NAD(P)-dependent dehydrogenase (short-subunit alcohol dehydrogenase family)